MHNLSDEHEILDADQLSGLVGETHPLAVKKCRPRLDKHAKDFIARSPFICIGTQGADGTADVSPKGDPPGFVRVIDDVTLAIPDRPGNNRLDSMSNLLSNPAIGLLFMIPGYDDTLRVNGKARLTTDPALLAEMAIRERPPKMAIVVDVDEVFLHCAKAFKRSKLWSPDAIQDRSEMPTLGKMIMEQTSETPPTETDFAEADESVESDYRDSLY
ncbi:MAG: pyridoxamine 5'-phosphate oxidase family protein [Hyphomicrobiales bacterium]